MAHETLLTRALDGVHRHIDRDNTPHSIAAVDAGWIERRLNAAGHDVTLTGFDATPLGSGLMGNTYRLALRHVDPAPGTPRSVVFKCTGDSPASRQLGKRGFGIAGRPGFYGAEVRFYAQFASDLPIRTPRAYATWLSEEEDEFSLLLEDFPDSVAGDEFTGCTRAQAIECMAGLAGLHAPLWNSDLLRDGWLKPISAELKPVLAGNMARAVARLKERHQALFTAEDMTVIERFAPHYPDWSCAAGRPAALTHSDYRLDNMLFDGGHSVVLDWQTFATAHPVRDTVLFLGCSVPTETRRAVQDEALGAYHARLCELGVRDYSYDQCVDDFLFGTFIGLQNVVIGMNAVLSTDRGTQMFLNKLARCRATIDDHRALDRFFA
jgi:hypothetical protein